jgi:hypothetical protein
MGLRIFRIVPLPLDDAFANSNGRLVLDVVPLPLSSSRVHLSD